MKQTINKQVSLVRAPSSCKITNIGLATTLRHVIGIGFGCLALALSTTAFALEFECEVPNDTRYLRVDIPGHEHLCEVSVTYLQSGVREVKWHASNDTLFCSARAYELRDKYEELWNYSCTTWPDRDGIDNLSPSQRLILDQRLKALINEGLQAKPSFAITAIKAVASNPLDNEPGKIAFQFFTENSDFTEIIDDQSDVWRVDTTISTMSTHISGDLPVSAAVIHSISDEGTLEVHTQLADLQNADCFGAQILTPVGSNGIIKARTPHRFICNTGDSSAQPLSEATNLESETTTQ